MQLFLLFFLILLNGMLAMTEIALLTAKRSRLGKLAENGDRAAEAAIKLGMEPTRFLSTIQAGITSIGILNGIIGEGVLAGPLALWFSSLGMDEEFGRLAATAVAVVSITYVTIVVGELVPKRLAQFNPEGTARLLALPMMTLSAVAKPFVKLLSFSTDTVLRLLGKNPLEVQRITEEEIHALLEEGSVAGVIEQHEHEMVRNVFRLDDRQLGTLMVPRADIVFGWLYS